MILIKNSNSLKTKSILAKKFNKTFFSLNKKKAENISKILYLRFCRKLKNPGNVSGKKSSEMMKRILSAGLFGLLADFADSAPSNSFNATQLLLDAHINPGQLTIARRSPDYIGPRLAPTWDKLGNLFTVIN